VYIRYTKVKDSHPVRTEGIPMMRLLILCAATFLLAADPPEVTTEQEAKNLEGSRKEGRSP
jgi:hypothetical protein